MCSRLRGESSLRSPLVRDVSLLVGRTGSLSVEPPALQTARLETRMDGAVWRLPPPPRPLLIPLMPRILSLHLSGCSASSIEHFSGVPRTAGVRSPHGIQSRDVLVVRQEAQVFVADPSRTATFGSPHVVGENARARPPPAATDRALQATPAGSDLGDRRHGTQRPPRAPHHRAIRAGRLTNVERAGAAQPRHPPAAVALSLCRHRPSAVLRCSRAALVVPDACTCRRGRARNRG